MRQTKEGLPALLLRHAAVADSFSSSKGWTIWQRSKIYLPLASCLRLLHQCLHSACQLVCLAAQEPRLVTCEYWALADMTLMWAAAAACNVICIDPVLMWRQGAG